MEAKSIVKSKSYDTAQNRIVEVEFRGGYLQAVQIGADIWVSVRRVCEHLGIDRNGQQQKLRDPERSPWATRCIMHLVAEDGKIREQFMLHIDSFPMWLATIDAGRMNQEARPLLIAYQKEAAKVLRDHFFGNQNAIQRVDAKKEYKIEKEYKIDNCTLSIYKSNDYTRYIERIFKPIKRAIDLVEKLYNTEVINTYSGEVKNIRQVIMVFASYVR